MQQPFWFSLSLFFCFFFLFLFRFLFIFLKLSLSLSCVCVWFYIRWKRNLKMSTRRKSMTIQTISSAHPYKWPPPRRPLTHTHTHTHTHTLREGEGATSNRIKSQLEIKKIFQLLSLWHRKLPLNPPPIRRWRHWLAIHPQDFIQRRDLLRC